MILLPDRSASQGNADSGQMQGNYLAPFSTLPAGERRHFDITIQVPLLAETMPPVAGPGAVSAHTCLITTTHQMNSQQRVTTAWTLQTISMIHNIDLH